MTNFEKRQRLEKRFYEEIKKGNSEKAEQLMKKLVAMDVKNCRK